MSSSECTSKKNGISVKNKYVNLCTKLTYVLKLLSYKTSPQYQPDFEKTYLTENFLMVKRLSLICLTLGVIARLAAVFYLKETDSIKNYDEYALSNLIILIGHSSFATLSHINFNNKKAKELIPQCFIIFILMSSMYISYVNSMHNTKNTLTALLIGIVASGLFFVLELRTIIFITAIFIASFWMSIIESKIIFFEKVLNISIGATLGMVLLFISRYSYYFKSKNFTRLKQLEEKNIEIANLNNQKTDVLAYVAHDLRTPLSFIKMLTHINPTNISEKEKAEMLEQAVNQAEHTINDLLDALMEHNSGLETENVKLTEYLAHIVHKWSRQSKRNIVLELPNNPVYANINRLKMERVMDNLIQNAIKFSGSEKSILITLNVSDQIEIKVIDNGIGIPDKLIPSIFDQFTSHGRKGLQGERSFGIGLHLSKKIIELHNGKINVSSEEGKGTEFSILLEHDK